MNRKEFLKQLREALENEVSSTLVKENIDYYNQYISEETKKGISEREVIDMLGDPWALARTIIDSAGSSQSDSTWRGTAYEPSEEQNAGTYRKERLGLTSWWRILKFSLAVIGVFIIVLVIIRGIIGILMPILVPLVLIVLLVRIFKNR